MTPLTLPRLSWPYVPARGRRAFPREAGADAQPLDGVQPQPRCREISRRPSWHDEQADRERKIRNTTGTPPVRGRPWKADGVTRPRWRPGRRSLYVPADLVRQLLTRVRLSEAEVAAMSKERAIARMQQYWTTGS